MSVCHQFGAEYNSLLRPEAAQQSDLVFDVLTRLHARGCQVASEVVTLVKAGFADGAHARWRTLHEIAVTAMFISKHGSDVAERYLHHSAVTDYIEAQQYQRYCKLLGYKPLSTNNLTRLRQERDIVIQRYGVDFTNDNGWACKALGSSRPKFTDIERDVHLNHLRPFYKLANMNVHAGSKSVSHRLGMPPKNNEILLSGSSVYGIAEPAQNTAVSIQQLTITLLLSRPNISRIASSKAIQKLMDEVVWSFDKVMQAMEQQY